MPPMRVIDIHLGQDDLDRALRADVRAGLTASPKELPPKWFYDERGSELFDEITKLDEYYPTEAERSILLANAANIIDLAVPDTIVELGSGTSDKTRALLDAGSAAGTLRRFVPFDVSEAFLRQSVGQLAERYPELAIHGVVGDFDRHLPCLPGGDRQLLMLLGGTIGNYRPKERRELLTTIAGGHQPGDHVLVGVDLVKDVGRLERAYDDARGVTAEFNRNVLAVINRRLDADFLPDRFDHVARFDPDEEWIEMLLRSRGDQTVRVGALDLDVSFADGELMRTEVSCKFRREGIEADLLHAGLEPVRWLLDPAGDFAVSISRR